MTICPFISTNNGVTSCHPMCALLIDGQCAIKVLAMDKLADQKTQTAEKPADHK